MHPPGLKNDSLETDAGRRDAHTASASIIRGRDLCRSCESQPTAPSTTLRNILIQVVEGTLAGSGWENLFTAVIRIPHLGEQVYVTSRTSSSYNQDQVGVYRRKLSLIKAVSYICGKHLSSLHLDPG